MRVNLAVLALVLAHLGQNAAFIAVRANRLVHVSHRSAPISCSFDELAIEAKVKCQTEADATSAAARAEAASAGSCSGPELQQSGDRAGQQGRFGRDDHVTISRGRAA